MSDTAAGRAEKFGYEFCLESYGVVVKIQSNTEKLLAEAQETAKRALVDRLKFFDSNSETVVHSYGLIEDNAGGLFLYKDNVLFTDGGSKYVFLKFFNSMLRLTVAEHAPEHVFLHSGVVGWNGKAIIVPANSFHGKTTLIAELVRSGAEYYSDEYAVLDKDGRVHPFPRMLSIRNDEGTREDDISVEEFGGKAGIEPIEVGMVLVTKYEDGSEWNPKFLSAGEGMMEIIPHTVPLRANPEFSLGVLRKVTNGAIIVKSPRPEAAEFAKTLLDFFDKNN